MEETESRRPASNPVPTPKPDDILYRLDERPPWHLCVLLAVQQFLTSYGTTFSYPIIISGAICLTGDSVGLSELISTVTVVAGISSFLQTTIGVRLPLIQGPSFSYISPVFVIMQSECPKFDNTTLVEQGSVEHKEIWQSNLRSLQGAMLVSCLFQVIIGFTGLIGLLMRYIGPLTIAPTVALVGLSVFDAAAEKAQSQWWISIMTMLLVIIFSQYLRKVEIPIPWLDMSLRIFALFPVLFGIVVAWIICVILTLTDVLPNDPNKWGYLARTDIKTDSLRKSPWFRFPYPGQWGTPTVTLDGITAMLAAVIATMIESVGDYYTCARMTAAPPPPGSAVSRGIGISGINCLLGGAWGTGGGSTTYSSNVATIGMTKVASRIVFQTTSLILILLGCFVKFGALFATLPDPILGGLFFLMFGMIASVGISNLQCVDLNSTRNLIIFGFSTFFGLSMPKWLSTHENAINTGSQSVDQILRVLLSTGMLVGGTLAFVMDNTIPGTKEERGLVPRNTNTKSIANHADISVYDLPYVQPFLNEFGLMRYVPFCPNFIGDKATGTDRDEINGVPRDAEAVHGGEINPAYNNYEHSTYI